MSTLDDVYRKFGETSEAAQLLRTELGNVLLLIGAVEADLFEKPDPTRASDLYRKINRQTLGQLIRNARGSTDTLDHLDTLLSDALNARNRLAHEFYRQHNFRRNSSEGRTLMVNDLQGIHSILLEAYKAVMRLSGVDLDAMDFDAGDLVPQDHLPI